MSQTDPTGAADDRVIIKKYANRRLYNTRSSTYVTLEHLAEMVRNNVDFVVYDAKTGEDITRSVLTQIIFDEESRGQNLLPIQFLRQLIRFYGDSMQAFLPSYLELSLDSFIRQQERLRGQITGSIGAAPGVAFVEDQVRQNLQLFNRAMQMFSPFGFPQKGETPAEESPQTKGQSDATLEDLKRRMEDMQAQLAKLASKE